MSGRSDKMLGFNDLRSRSVLWPVFFHPQDQPVAGWLDSNLVVDEAK